MRAGHSDGLRAYTLAGLANLTSAAARNRGGLRLHGCVGAVCVCACVDACACVCVDGAKPGGPNSPNAAHPALSLGVVALGTLLAALSRIAGLFVVLRAVACVRVCGAMCVRARYKHTHTVSRSACKRATVRARSVCIGSAPRLATHEQHLRLLGNRPAHIETSQSSPCVRSRMCMSVPMCPRTRTQVALSTPTLIPLSPVGLSMAAAWEWGPALRGPEGAVRQQRRLWRDCDTYMTTCMHAYVHTYFLSLQRERNPVCRGKEGAQARGGSPRPPNRVAV